MSHIRATNRPINEVMDSRPKQPDGGWAQPRGQERKSQSPVHLVLPATWTQWHAGASGRAQEKVEGHRAGMFQVADCLVTSANNEQKKKKPATLRGFCPNNTMLLPCRGRELALKKSIHIGEHDVQMWTFCWKYSGRVVVPKLLNFWV